jgi:N-acetylmuramoyl-L-alanine amidase
MATLADVRAKLSAQEILAFTAYGEAANQGIEGQVAVMCTARNRATIKHLAISDVCLAPYQYSCWNDPGHAGVLWLMAAVDDFLAAKLLAPVLNQCLGIAALVVTRTILDNIDGATHYLTTAALATNPPRWTQPPAIRVATIRDHVFFRGVAPFV